MPKYTKINIQNAIQEVGEGVAVRTSTTGRHNTAP